MPSIILSKDGVVLREVRLVKERLTIGRAPYNDIVLEDRAVSSEHAVIVTRDGDSFLEDLNSTNGTQVNGQPVRMHFLRDGDLAQLAQFCIAYTAVDVVTRGGPAVSEKLPVLRVLSGATQGVEMDLGKPMTSIGVPEAHVAVILRDGPRFMLRGLAGFPSPRVNGTILADEARPLRDGDIIEVAEIELLFTRE